MRAPLAPLVEWEGEGPDAVLRDRRYGDVYFSREGGLAETRLVFLEGCGLPRRWAGRDAFSILETGFGVGLNAAATLDVWRRTRPPGAILHYASIEAHPLGRADAARALAAFPEVAPESAAILAQWPVRAFGPQRIWLPRDGFCLTVWVGEAERVLPLIQGQVNAWFLDGFAPARNPAMWGPDLGVTMARLSAPDATAATYSVAARVRETLTLAGFQAVKRPGFGAKRERLEAWRGGEAEPASQSCGEAAVIGAGLAGAGVAAALRRRGVACAVFEAEAAPAQAASGNPAGLVSPRLDRGETPAAEFFRAAYLFAVDAYRALGPAVFDPCGVWERPVDANEAAVMADLLADPPLPSDHLEGRGDGLFFPSAGIARPRAIVERMLEGAVLRLGIRVAGLAWDGAGWALQDANGRAVWSGGQVFLAGGAAEALAPAAWLPLERTRGQLDWGPAVGGPEGPVSRGTYAVPLAEALLFGATFDRIAPGAAVAPDLASRARNLAALEALAPGARVAEAALQSRAAVRAATADRVPIAGALPDGPAWWDWAAGLVHGRAPEGEGPMLVGVHVVAGLGSRGLTHAPLAGELAVSLARGEPPPLDRAGVQALAPARFLARALRRRQSPPF